MKYKEVTSAIVGGAFFALPYVGLAIPLLPSVVIGAGAYAASELLLSGFSSNKKKKMPSLSLKTTLENAKKQAKHILEMIPQIEDEQMKQDLFSINDSVNKIIKTIEKNPKKYKGVGNLFDYYLPVVVNILDRYDDVENQRLTSKDGYKFLESVGSMMKEAKIAFQNILANIYETDIMDADAEMKVFVNMVKADGIGKKELELEEKDE